MAGGTTPESTLIKLSESNLTLREPAHDVRGLDAYDRDGEQIGTVEDLYADEKAREVRFLDIGAGGFLGLGEKHFLIPVEAIQEMSEDQVIIDQSRERVAGSPPLDTGVVPEPESQQVVYDYYGYPYPPWAAWPRR
jgi:sporulation protein YlmC with PRC-barrel domain